MILSTTKRRLRSPTATLNCEGCIFCLKISGRWCREGKILLIRFSLVQRLNFAHKIFPFDYSLVINPGISSSVCYVAHRTEIMKSTKFLVCEIFMAPACENFRKISKENLFTNFDSFFNYPESLRFLFHFRSLYCISLQLALCHLWLSIESDISGR